MTIQLSEEQTSKLKEAPPLLDKDDAELTTAEESDAVLSSLGLNITEGKLQDMIHRVGADNNDTIDLSGGSIVLTHKMVDTGSQKVKEREAIDNERGESGGNSESGDLVAGHDKDKVFESKLPSSSGTTPSMDGNTIITGSTFPETGDAADVWRLNNVQEEGKPETSRVLKMIRVYPQDFDDTAAGYKISWDDFVRDLHARVSAWAQFDHPNVVRVYPARDLGLCAEFCSHGSVRDYLKTPTGQQADKFELIHDILMGVEYLHSQSPPIVHGSLSAGKVFVDIHGKAKIGEFGLVDFCSQVPLLAPQIFFQGFVRCTSPEVFDINPDGSVTRTTQSDVWALGCILFEILSGELPYSQHQVNGALLRAIRTTAPGDFASVERLRKDIQGRCVTGGPIGSRNVDFDSIRGDRFWSLMVEPCWSRDPAERPSVAELVLRHTSMKDIWEPESHDGSLGYPQSRAVTSMNSGNIAKHATPSTSLGSTLVKPLPLDSTPENEH